MRARPGRLWLLVVSVGLTAASIPARADVEGDANKRLGQLRSELSQLSQGVKRPDLGGQSSRDQANRQLVDAQVAFGLGNYDDAAVMFHEYVQKNQGSPSYDTAVYYLAEALFQKRDFMASRTYFTQLVRDIGPSSKFYQQSLERLLELSLKLDDSQDVDQWLLALDNVPAGKRRSSVPYIRGKYAYFKQQYDEALSYFANVPAGTDYHLQARYFMGASYVAKGDLAKAQDIYADLVKQKPKSSEGRRVVELSHMALGRVYYERDQPSKAIDSYLEISRKSDLFDEVLYEVAWVYVKNRQFDKALRALELLALADPTSSKLPAVKILEGNLRIRKAQALKLGESGNSAEEYAKALAIFEWTHENFEQSYEELTRVIAAHADPGTFMAQITGRQSETFDTKATLPEVAAAWIREQPEVQRLVLIESDLGDIAENIADAERTIERLEQAIGAQSRVYLFPSLAEKRARATEILEEVFAIRQRLSGRTWDVLRRHASESEKAQLQAAQARREDIARQLAALPNAEVSYSERVERARNDFVALDQRAAEVTTVIDTTEATLVALEKYIQDQTARGATVPSAEAARTTIRELRAEVDTMRAELEAVKREAILAKDAAGTGDSVALRARALRAELRQVLDEEYRAMTRIVARMQGGDRQRGDRLVSLTRTANALSTDIDELDRTIDSYVEAALADVQSALVEERANLAAYKREFSIYEAESRALGSTILAASFLSVKDKFYDVLVRSDIGVIDVAWSQKEDIDEAVQKLNLDKLRELRTLQDEFRDIIEEDRADTESQTKPAAPAGQEVPAKPEAPAEQEAPAAPVGKAGQPAPAGQAPQKAPAGQAGQASGGKQ